MLDSVNVALLDLLEGCNRVAREGGNNRLNSVLNLGDYEAPGQRMLGAKLASLLTQSVLRVGEQIAEDGRHSVKDVLEDNVRKDTNELQGKRDCELPPGTTTTFSSSRSDICLTCSRIVLRVEVRPAPSAPVEVRQE